MKKIFIIVIPFVLICVIIYVHNVKSNFDFSKLKLDQGEAYISLNMNDIEGYNRWVPFYFALKTKKNLSVEEVENLLSKEISKVTLYTDDETLYQTDQLIFSAYKLERGSYNLT